jgi:hypothetical protein
MLWVEGSYSVIVGVKEYPSFPGINSANEAK